ncbi:MAG TPA: FecR domain-containing protein [Thermoanaerobaculia bacterium]|nr:FecR domain-containing protein [Thermoanaerobaculia bacterium]
MKKLLLLVAIAAIPLHGQTPETIGYRFDEVKRTVTLTSAKQETKAAKGATARSGDAVHTGWFSYALIASEKHRAKFELYGNTDVELAGGTPGMILSLKKGRIHAMFDKITGSDPRVVQTPGALLAVRGTQYSVSVNDKGETTLDVFEGIVEVQSPLRPQPIFVRAGQSTDFGRRRPPDVYRTPEDRGPAGPHTRRKPEEGPRDGQPQPRNGETPRDGGQRPPGPGSGPGGGGGGQQPPPPPPPHGDPHPHPH